MLKFSIMSIAQLYSYIDLRVVKIQKKTIVLCDVCCIWTVFLKQKFLQ
jgi:hypothetical protein